MNRFVPTTLRRFAAVAAITALGAGFGSARASDPQPTVPAIVNDTMAAVPAARSASIEVFTAAPLPNENLATPKTQVADAGQPDLHPDLLSMHESTSGALSGTTAEYDRTQRVRPAGGMSLSIPMQ